MKQAKIIDVDEKDYPTNAVSVDKALKAYDFKLASFNQETMEGVASYHGIRVEFTIGDENLYFRLPEVFVKQSPVNAVNALSKFLDIVRDLGGAVTPLG